MKRVEWVIVFDLDEGFTLFNPEGGIAYSEGENGPTHPRKLSQFAFSRGADAVRHDYDLSIAEVAR